MLDFPQPLNTPKAMNSSLLNNSRSTGLMNRVREDVSTLRDDIRHLISHTTRQTLPNGARELAGQAKLQISSRGANAATHLRDLGTRHPAGLIGGAVVIGLLAAGAYALTHQHNGHQSATLQGSESEPDILC